MRASIALLFSGLAAQQVAAHWDRQASNYNTPGYNNNECTDKQKGGYDWSDLNDGDKPGKYDDFNFGGDWSCSTKKFGKRDHLSKRTFGAKAITNSCGKEKPASFSCDQKKEGFSLTHIDVSVDHDADLDFHYKMKDGSVCKQRASCKKEGTTVQNTQCGGAESVDVYLGNSSEGRDDCEIGFHQIGFDCNPGESYTPPPAYTPPVTSEAPSSSSEVPPTETTPPPQTSDSPPSGVQQRERQHQDSYLRGYTNSTAPPTPPETPVSSTPVESTPAESTPAESTPAESTPAESSPASSTPSGECGGYGQPACEASSTPAESTPAESTPAESTPAESTPAESTPAESSPASSTPPPSETTPSGECGGYGQPACEASSTPAESTPAESTPAESSPASSTPSGECGGYGQPACEASSTPVESQPAESTPVSSAPADSTTPPTETAPATSYNGTVPSSPVSSQPPTVTPPPGGYTPPDCLPKCLNTWLKIKSECKDNTDSACYCKVPDLTDNVIDCVKAYGTEEEVQQALSYFVGICAPQIPENPGIIGKCTDVPLAPPSAPVSSAPASSAPASSAPEAPATSAAGYTPATTAAGETPATTPAPEQPTTPAPGQPETPATTPAPAPEQPSDIPCTTITYGGSSYTVPQVGFTTETPGAPGANPTEPIALYPAAPTPAPAPANPTAPYPVASGASGFTSVSYPTGTGAPNTPPPSEFTGAASALNVKAGMVFGAALAFFAL
ncbi:uncharacterized protein N0V89_008806 [Didymosphaeria variabile]|uniref:CFEM domain-containing protein n=1 Tax=Didymosphaeria variabile TaxID=1932322 RepID=A0A9W8XGZ4_9PLEO|nr:uncharacterized protein N0V89_008806 [Didymosphaeria variabile]KAJ4350185.1 hypothetical protein N0V89_008806 [Didymosphaeria variabile]